MWIVVAAWISACLVFSSFFMKTMIPLRVVAIASNVAFITYALLGLVYGVFGRVYPILVLHASLLPLNVVRLRQLRRLLAAVHATTHEAAVDALIPYMRTETRKQGEVIFRQGEAADALYVLQSGRVEFPEVGKQVGPGSLFGEVGIFAPQGVRALSAVCAEDCRLATISREKVLELYCQNPKFGLFLIRVVSGFVVEGRPQPVWAAQAPSAAHTGESVT